MLWCPCYWPESRIKIRVAVNAFATTGRECTLPSQYSGRLTSGKGYPARAQCGRPVIRSDLQWSDAIWPWTRAARSLTSGQRPRSEIVNKVTHTLTCTACAPLSVSVTTQNGGRSLEVLRGLVVLVAAPTNGWRSFFFRFQEAERHTVGHPKIALDLLCLKDATLCLFSHLNLVLSSFAHHKSDLGWSTFSCVHWSVVGEVAPLVPLGPGWK